MDRLADRYEQLPSRSTVLDPAVLVLQQELWQHRILPPPLVAALGPDYDDLLPLLFDRDELLISASFLPEVLFRLEHSATRLWLEIADTAKNNAVLGNVLMQISADWLEPWTAAEAPTRAFEQDNPANLDEHYASLQTVLDSLILPQAPDQLRVKRLLFDLHRALPSMPPCSPSSCAPPESRTKSNG